MIIIPDSHFNRDNWGNLILTFGKYSGKMVREILIENYGYIEWLLNESNVDMANREIIDNEVHKILLAEPTIMPLPDPVPYREPKKIEEIMEGIIEEIITSDIFLFPSDRLNKLIAIMGDQHRPHVEMSKAHQFRLLELKNKLLSMDACCYVCGRKRKTLHLHHKHYNTWGCETLDDLVLLCPPCHVKVTYRKVE